MATRQFDVYFWDERKETLAGNLGTDNLNSILKKHPFGEEGIDTITLLTFVRAGLNNALSWRVFVPEDGSYAISLMPRDLGLEPHVDQEPVVWEYLPFLHGVLAEQFTPEQGRNLRLLMSKGDYHHLGLYNHPQIIDIRKQLAVGGVEFILKGFINRS